MSNPMFSIIVPVYNTEKELERCVCSVTCQTYRDFELILVDDGSKDSSGELCDTFSAKDSRIVTIHRQNAGCSEARNTGIRASKGSYMIFVDSDDMWDDENALQDIADIIYANPEVDVVCFGVRIYNENGRFVKERKPLPPTGPVTEKEEIVRYLVYTNGYISTSYVKALRREFFLDRQLFFIKGLLSEDIEWSARILLGCKTIAIYPNAFYKRIQRSEGSITSSIGKKNITDILGSIERGVALVEEKAENEKMKALYYEYWAYQYAMLIGLTNRIHSDEEFPSILRRLNALKWLLGYDHVKKVHAVRQLTSVFGIRGASNIVSIYYHLK